MRLKKDFNEIIVQETPGCLWIFGLFFAVIGGIIVFGSLGGFSDYESIPAWQIWLAGLMGAIAVAVGTMIIYRAPVSTVVINRRDETVTLKRFGLFGRRAQAFTFDRLKQFLLVEEADDEGSPIWSLGMELTNGETIKISSMPSHTDQIKRNLVFEINEFIHKPLPSYKAFDELEDESEAKIS